MMPKKVRANLCANRKEWLNNLAPLVSIIAAGCTMNRMDTRHLFDRTTDGMKLR